MNNKTLAIIFGSLLLIYAASKLLGGNKEKSFDSQILLIDESKIDKIIVTQPEETFTLSKNGADWSVHINDKTYAATTNAINSLLDNITDVKATRIVSKNPEKWKDYEVEDGKPRVQLFQGSKLIADLQIGRFSFDQVSRSGNSYIRKNGENEVYVVDGFSSMTLRQKSGNYRNKKLAQIAADQVQSINYNGAKIERAGEGWNFNDQLLDSTEMADFLNGFNNLTGTTFTDETPAGTYESLIFNTANGQKEIRAYPTPNATNDFLIQSTENAEGVFASDSSGVYNRIFGKLRDIINP